MKRRSQSQEYEYLYLTEAEEARARIGFLPVGSIESHGGSLPLGTDALIARAFALAFARRVGGVIFPPISYGFCPNTSGFPGTISPGPAAFLPYLTEVCRELHRKACDKIIILNVHRGNDAAIALVVDDLFHSDGISLYYVNPYTFLGEEADANLFAGKDNSYREATLLLASLRALDDPRVSRYVSETDEVVKRPPELEQLRQHGALGFSYSEERAHVAPRKDVDIEKGMAYFRMAEDKIAELVAVWKRLEC